MSAATLRRLEQVRANLQLVVQRDAPTMVADELKAAGFEVRGDGDPVVVLVDAEDPEPTAKLRDLHKRFHEVLVVSIRKFSGQLSPSAAAPLVEAPATKAETPASPRQFEVTPAPDTGERRRRLEQQLAERDQELAELHRQKAELEAELAVPKPVEFAPGVLLAPGPWGLPS